jgi:hypothetical protein
VHTRNADGKEKREWIMNQWNQEDRGGREEKKVLAVALT